MTSDVTIPADVAVNIAEFLRSMDGHPDDNRNAEAWADLLDPRPVSLRAEVERVMSAANIDGAYSEADVDAVLAVVKARIGALPAVRCGCDEPVVTLAALDALFGVES